jgi:protein tyrosine phosphatase (PTP) superfamily phosphohydrolase (DUF442 family)
MSRPATVVVVLIGALSACTMAGPREVLPGRLYLAGQPERGECAEWIERFGIRSFVNLRGSDEDRRSFLEEKACTDGAGIVRLDLPFLAADDPPRHLVRDFLRRFPSLPEPVLVHCRSGVDRSAMGVFLGMMLMDRPFAEAAAWVRSPFKHPCFRACPQRRFVNAFEAWCAGQGRTPDRAALVDWIERDYCPASYRWAGALEGVPAHAAPGGSVRFSARVTNSGDRAWALHAGPARGVRLGVRLFGPLAQAPEDPEAAYYALRPSGWDACRAGMQEGTVRPGEDRVWTLAFAAPAAEGLYLMAVDMVDEGKAWFSDGGRPPLLSFLRVGAAAEHPAMLY